MSTLQSWLEEFQAMGYPIAGWVKVIQQDGDDGADTGLVGVRLANGSTATYIQPEPETGEWVVTLEPRETSVTLTPASLLSLSAELAMVSALCAFLQAKSTAFLAWHTAEGQRDR